MMEQRKENQRVMLTKRLLRDALMELLTRRDINAISVSELCRHAGINRATFYKHYATPNDVLNEISYEHTLRLLNWPKTQVWLDDPAAQIKKSCVYLYENAALFRILIRNSMDERVRDSIVDTMLQSISQLETAEAFSIHQENVQLALTFIGNGCFSLLRRWLMEDLDKSPQEIAALLVQLSTHGWLPK